MKVILTAEVKGKGHEGDIVEVAHGYAVNFLLPRKMAIEATSGNVKQLEARMNNINKRNASRMSDAEAVAASIEGKTVVIHAKAGVDGKLFGSVTTLMIEEAVEAQLGADIDHKRMNLTKPIKTAGEHLVTVSVFGDVKAGLTVNVVPEGVVVEAAPAAVAEAVVVEGDEPVDETAIEAIGAVEDAEAVEDVVVEDEAADEAVAEDETATETD
jgi:large subunit ribosomal protein L9